MTPKRRSEYGLSPDSWTRATRELVDFGLINVDRAVRGGDLESVRARNFYSVNKERLNEPVGAEDSPYSRGRVGTRE